jgi:hypothetical protein
MQQYARRDVTSLKTYIHLHPNPHLPMFRKTDLRHPKGRASLLTLTVARIRYSMRFVPSTFLIRLFFEADPLPNENIDLGSESL